MYRALTQRLQPSLILRSTHHPALLSSTFLQQQHSNLSFLAWLRRTFRRLPPTPPKAATQPAATTTNPPTSTQTDASSSPEEVLVYPVYNYSTSIANTGNPLTDQFSDVSGLSLYRGPTLSQDTTSKTTTSKAMASDEDYAAFLEKTNQPTSLNSASTQQIGNNKGFTAKTVDTEQPVPKVLQDVESVYVSEADEEFVPVSLGWSGKGGKVDLAAFAKLISKPKSKVTSLSAKEFDPRNQYGEVVDAVKQAGTTGQVEVFRVELEGARCEYWVVCVDEKGARVVGLKVGAVES